MPAKKKTTKRKTAPKQDKASTQARKQMWAVILFALGLLLAALTLIEGGKLWSVIHGLLFGIFGWSVYFLAPLLIYIAVAAAMDRPLSILRTKLWQVAALIVIISGAIQVFGAGLPDGEGFIAKFLALYESGKALKGGGIAGAVFAVPLISLFDVVGAKIIIVLLILVFAMLVTGSTLIGIFRGVKALLGNVGEAYADTLQSRDGKPEKVGKPEKKPVSAEKKQEQPRFNIDVDISGDKAPEDFSGDEDGLPGHPVISEKSAPPPLFEAFAEPPVQEPEPPVVVSPPQDSPVEYISPAEFQQSTQPAQVAAATATRAHPLDEDISAAQRRDEGEDPFGIHSLISRMQPELIRLEDDIVTEIVDEPVVIVPEEPPAEPVEVAEVQDADPAPRTIPAFDPPTSAAYLPPPPRLLSVPRGVSGEDVSEELKTNAQTLVDTLKSFGVQTRITDICRGPAVTRYELQPSAGVKISKITGLADDIALNLAASGIRIEAPIPNKPAVGIEIPNKIVSIVSIREIIDSPAFEKADSSVSVALGKDIAGNITLADIGKMPHLLIAGSTGSGKSVCINSIIISLLYKSSPDEVKLLMVDPKVVELGIYNGIPHLLVPVVTDPKKAAGALAWAVSEMLNRYKTFAAASVRDLAGYNRLAAERDDLKPMPKIVIIIDELADLMMAAPNEVEDSICRLAQMARAAGMHLVIATQRPSVDVITGVIKANIPSRIAFAVSSMVDSRTILDMGGAEKLLGRGDMLYYPVGAAKPQRVQGCFVTDMEVERVVEFIKESDRAEYDESIAEEIDRHAVAEKPQKGDGGGLSDDDEMLPLAIECVVEAGQASTSQLQRRLKLGYARAARIIDQLEERGIVGPFEGSKPRQVTISRERWLEMKLAGAESDARVEARN